MILHLALFLLTCLSTTWAGASYSNPTLSAAELIRRLPDGLPFSAALMSILLSHEMGHYILGRRRGVAVSLPFFIPIPFGLVGTMGAVIRMPKAVEDRDALVDIGAAGPIAGLVVALPVLALGIHFSAVQTAGEGLLEGNSIIYWLLKYAIKGQWLPSAGLDVALHPVAWAGWVGLLVTMINLLPIGQLDGGHLAFAYFGDRHDRVSAQLHRALLPLAVGASLYSSYELSTKLGWRLALSAGVSAGMPWAIWWLLLRLMRRAGGGRYHPPVGAQPLSPSRRRLCIAVLVIFVLIFIPIPLRLTA